ncbi:MAG TPA: Crp/Fnr family transcriptional regulator [Thermodesulfobacteriota bacterium]
MTAADPFAALLDSARRRDLAAGEALFRQGYATTAIFVVEAGRVLLVRHTSEGVGVTVHVARPGETFAEAALFSDRYHCDAVAEVPSRVAVLPRAAVRRALRADPEVAEGFMRQMAAQIQVLRARLELRNVRSARARVLQYLALAPRGAIGGDRPLKQVAAEIGLTHEALYRTLAALEAEGRIAREGRAVRLLQAG